MEAQPSPNTRLQHRFLVVLRAPVRDLAPLLPDGVTPLERRGVGFVLLDTSTTRARRIGPLLLGPVVDRLSWKVPITSHRTGKPLRGLWIARRWSSAGRLARFTEHQLGRGLSRNAALGLPIEPTLPASFVHREEGLHTELEVRSHAGRSSTRTAYLRTEAYGQLEGSVFASVRAAEEEFQSWAPTPLGPHPAAEFETTRFATGPLALQPLAVHSLQTASLPELLPGIESRVELDSAFRVVRRRMQPLQRRLETWKKIQQGGTLTLPPEGAFSVYRP